MPAIAPSEVTVKDRTGSAHAQDRALSRAPRGAARLWVTIGILLVIVLAVAGSFGYQYLIKRGKGLLGEVGLVDASGLRGAGFFETTQGKVALVLEEFTISGSKHHRLATLSLDAQKLLHDRVLDDEFGVLAMSSSFRYLGQSETFAWFQGGKSGLHTRDPLTGEVLVSQDKLVAAIPQLAAGFDDQVLVDATTGHALVTLPGKLEMLLDPVAMTLTPSSRDAIRARVHTGLGYHSGHLQDGRQVSYRGKHMKIRAGGATVLDAAVDGIAILDGVLVLDTRTNLLLEMPDPASVLVRLKPKDDTDLKLARVSLDGKKVWSMRSKLNGMFAYTPVKKIRLVAASRVGDAIALTVVGTPTGPSKAKLNLGKKKAKGPKHDICQLVLLDAATGKARWKRVL